MGKINLRDLKKYEDIKGTLIKMAGDFLNTVFDNTPNGYWFLDLSENRINIGDVHVYNGEEIEIEYYDVYDLNDIAYISELRADKFIKDPIKYAKEWCELQYQLEKKRRENEAERKAEREERERDLAEYERIKKKYKLD